MKSILLGVLPLAATLLLAQPLLAADPEQKDPQAVAADVTKALRATREINSKDISVTTHAGTIVLSGSVATEPEAARAITVAEKAAAGVRVSSSVKVEPQAPTAPDSASVQLVRDVEAALHTDPRTTNLMITVGVDAQKIIQLQGLVPSRQDRAAAQTVASQVKGVTKVDNRLLPAGE